ncbi:MAG: transketolase [Opitutaceae bacterium]|nr:transketolase [Opitutaceae bacterium]
MKNPTPDQIRALDDRAFAIRRLCLEFITNAGWGHVGGSFSEAELLACLYGGIMNVEPKQADDPRRDRFILSKAHASPALYAALALRGFFPVERLQTYCRLDGLDGHTQRGQCPGIEYSGGSLGTGLSYANGVALGFRLGDNFASRVYCLIGDGECNEGQIWEAAMSAAHYRLDNLIAIVDANKVMAKGKVSELMAVAPLADKFAAFGWTPIEVDGHDVREICAAFHRAKFLEMDGRPVVVIAHTVKGRGVPEAEFNYHWHTHAPSPPQAEAFLRALNQTYGRNETFSRPLSAPSDGGLEAVVTADLGWGMIPSVDAAYSVGHTPGGSVGNSL